MIDINSIEELLSGSADELKLMSLVELWKKRDFSVLIPSTFQKQRNALSILTDNTTDFLAYGGAAGGGKSWAGCTWLAFNCKAYPGTQWFIGREELKRLTESTLVTFYKVCEAYGIKDYTFNAQRNFIKFSNGSIIRLLELKYLPSDPLYERYGSTEYTGGWIEEGGEVHFDAYDTLKSRIGRHMNAKYNLRKKMFITCNPKKNWLYTEYYKPALKGELPENKKFIQSLVTDNPMIEPDYIESLRNIGSIAKKERLLNGNWEYDDDPSALIDFDSIQDFFTNSFVKPINKRYITADIAMQGSDRFVVVIWKDWVIERLIIIKKSDGKEIYNTLQRLAVQYHVPRSHIAFDNDGLGSYLTGFLKGAYAFINNSKPVYRRSDQKDLFRNLKSQCYFHFAKKVVDKECWFSPTIEPSLREDIELEMAWIKDASIDTDKPLEVLPKDKIKEAIGRSPDLTDAFMMRSVFDLKRLPMTVTTR